MVEIENKTPDIGGLMTASILNTKLIKLRIKFLIKVNMLMNLMNFPTQYWCNNEVNAVSQQQQQ